MFEENNKRNQVYRKIRRK